MKKFLFVTAVIALLGACKKEDGDENPAPQTISFQDFYNEHGSHLQQFPGNATTGFTVTGARGTEIIFPPNAFLDLNGETVSGTVEVGIIEILTKKDILLSGVATESNGRVLESGGEVYIQARQNGNPLWLNPLYDFSANNPVRVRLPRDANVNPAGMMLFNLGARADAATLGNNSFTWLTFNERPVALAGPGTYNFGIDDFGWINVDRFLGYPADHLTYMHVEMAPGSAAGLMDVAVFLVFEDIKSVMGLGYDPETQRFGSEGYSISPNIPIGERVSVVVIAKDSQNTLYFDKQEGTIVVPDMLCTLAPEPATQDDLDWIDTL